MFFNKKKPNYDSEFDIEGIDVFAIDRQNDGNTVISYYDKITKNAEECWILTTIDKHNEYINRFRNKLQKNG